MKEPPAQVLFVFSTLALLCPAMKLLQDGLQLIRHRQAQPGGILQQRHTLIGKVGESPDINLNITSFLCPCLYGSENSLVMWLKPTPG